MNIGFGAKKGSKNASKYRDNSNVNSNEDSEENEDDDKPVNSEGSNVEMTDLRSRNKGKGVDGTRDSDDH